MRYMRLTSVVSAMRCKRKWINTSMREEWTVGPTSSKSLRETPVEERAEASKTARTLVVVLDSLKTT